MSALKYRNWSLVFLFTLYVLIASNVLCHEAKDFDDSVLYKIDFEMPDFDKDPDLKNHLRTFYTHDHEKYDCVIPVVQDTKEEQTSTEPELSPITLLQPLFSTSSCSYRIEAYWSYEICHGQHVRQSHEEREGKNVKLQEYYLGKWSDAKTEELTKTWESDRKAGVKYKTTKIENTRYPYFEIAMSDGTMCDIIDSPRTTHVRYVCYPHGKNEIYSFKETSSCNYEAIILTSVLCMIPAFHPEESKEVPIKCFNSPTEIHKPLSMLRQELSEMQLADDELPVSKDASTAAMALARSAAATERLSFFNKIGTDVDKLVLELMIGAGVDVPAAPAVNNEVMPHVPKAPITDLTAVKEFISGKNCLTGGTGWWKYEFCYGRHVRQFHKDKKSESELFLGYFSENSHRQWLAKNLDKMPKQGGYSSALWHHYDRGTHCDRTGSPREVDVKLMCTPISSSSSAVSIYLLEPKTCQYILVVESPIVCDLLEFADEYGLVHEETLQRVLQKNALGHEEKPPTEESVKEVRNVGNNALNDALPPQDVRA
ncbi:PREDICTED: endoplasmic reticulum lectin 1 [Rhagoletis zephyria]|uniref:endoplasmic reticulum lectin 1 n=1 Tax=Rhagoletis zephyria TaxID=28612 RepID=UPI000811956F|nr:PREDICTED: endoplasmic reticulum lectin 1 [Rhagoletis zephyria]